VELLRRYSKIPPLPKLDLLLTEKRTEHPRPFTRNVHRRLGPDIIAQLVADYEAGLPTTALTTTYGLSKGSVLQLLRQNGVEVRHQSLTPDQLQEAVGLYEQGWSLAKVGAHFARDASFIHVTFKREGIPRRDSHGRLR
jgi:hypothetical protein